ncbi:hypothetical protein D9Q98_004459 [Chlorella vulgaris]|uniref:Uncharacterized protein n=1 Tax=Chlorella vulgaris TaxID=3077 RepID=A0A9D4TPR0_CHLVU|nr:hypothetical protein D9Q98_004459 [Chlorella vulgaris]
MGSPYAAQPGYDVVHSQQAEERITLLVTTVDIGEGRAGRIEVCLGDDPIDVATAFCARHGLPEAIVLPLAQHLEENLAENEAAAAEAAGTPNSGRYAVQSGVQADAQDSDDEGEDSPYAARHSTPLNNGSTSGPAGQAGSQQGPGSSQQTASPAQHHQVGASSRNSGARQSPQPPQEAGGAGPRPQTAHSTPQAASGAQAQLQAPAKAPEADEQQGPLSYRPASIHSARGAEYYNRPPATSTKSPDSGSDSGAPYRSSGGSQPAHTRLYADHFRKQQRLEEERRLRDLEIQLKTEQVHIAPASNKLASHRTTGAYRNYGERLYVEGRLDALKREQLAHRVREEEARAEVDQFSFQPEISKLAQQIKQDEAERGSTTAYQRLYQRAATAKRQERMQAIRQEQDDAEVKECSFRPAINSKSSRMVQQRQQILKESGIAGYEQLYNDSMRRALKLQQLAQRPPEGATFRPRVNTSSVVLRKLLEGRAEGEVATTGPGADVATRLLEKGRRYQEKLQEAQRRQEEQPRDAATGQPLFRPKTHRAPQWERNPEGTPIGEYLYSIQAEWDERAARVQHASQHRKEQSAASTFVNTRSERLVDRLKRERFRAVFEYLGRGDPAPVLNLLDTIQDEAFMDTIDPEVRADIECAGRLLARAISRRQRTELQDSATSAPGSARGASPSFAQSTEGEVDVGGFVALMEDVMARTKGLTRQYLLPMPSVRQKFEEPTFRPAIDPHSQLLAARLRPASLPAYEALFKTAEQQATKREHMQRAAEAATLKECLFHPIMLAQPKGAQGRAIKMAAELSSKQASESGEASASSAAKRTQRRLEPSAGSRPSTGATPAFAFGCAGKAEAEAGGDGGTHFDVLEQQINEALLRLSLSEEQVAASLRQAAAAEVQAEAEAPREPLAAVQVARSVVASGHQLESQAICSSPSPEDLIAMPTGCGGTSSSLSAFNPLAAFNDGCSSAASPALPSATTVAWPDGSREAVAHPAGGSSTGTGTGCEELVGLDLHALACADLPEHAPQQPVAAA